MTIDEPTVSAVAAGSHSRLRYYFDEVTHCVVCGDDARSHRVLGQRLNRSQGFDPKSKDGIAVSVKQCRTCRVIYSSPQPMPFDLQDHYGVPPETYWGAADFSVPGNYFASQIATAKALLPFRPGMKALDIGAGLGKGMVALERAGFDVDGLEPSRSFHQMAVARLGINPARLALGAVEDVAFPESTFDFVTFGAVFEHLYNPADSLQRALAWLKPGGVMHLEVPSTRYLMSGLINLYYRCRGTNYVTNLSPMHQPYHLYEFDVRSFEHLGRRLGARIEQYQYDAWDVMAVPQPLRSMLTRWMAWTDTGVQLTIWLRKGD